MGDDMSEQGIRRERDFIYRKRQCGVLDPEIHIWDGQEHRTSHLKIHILEF